MNDHYFWAIFFHWNNTSKYRNCTIFTPIFSKRRFQQLKLFHFQILHLLINFTKTKKLNSVMHQAYVKTICKEKLTYTATLPKIAASTTVDWQDSADGGVWVSQRVRGRGPCVHWLQGEGGGGLHCGRRLDHWEGSGPRWPYLFCTYSKTVAINVAFFVVYICTTI